MASTSKPEVSSDLAKSSSSEEQQVDNHDIVEEDDEELGTDEALPPEVDDEAPINIWWDMENASRPYDVPADDVYRRIVSKLRDEGFNGPVNVIGVVAYADSYVPPNLSPEIVVHHAKKTNRPEKGSANDQVADTEIIKLIEDWLKVGHKPQIAMLITGDYGFRDKLSELSSAGHTVLLCFRVDENQNFTSSEDDKLSLLTLPVDEKQNVKFTKDNKLTKLSKYAHFYWNLRDFLSAPKTAISKRKRSEEFERRKKEEAEFEEAKKRKTESEAGVSKEEEDRV